MGELDGPICIFCHETIKIEGNDYSYARCLNCGAAGPRCDTEQEAIEQWEALASSDEKDVRIAKLTEALEVQDRAVAAAFRDADETQLRANKWRRELDERDARIAQLTEDNKSLAKLVEDGKFWADEAYDDAKARQAVIDEQKTIIKELRSIILEAINGRN
jgi:hypothetical protein